MELHGPLPGVPGLFRGRGASPSHAEAGFSHPAPPISCPSFLVSGLDGDWIALFPAAAAWRSNHFRDSPAPDRSQLDP